MSWTAINYSAIGSKNQQQGRPCQDYSHYRCYDDFIIGAVADGAGSAKYSDHGAELAVKTTLSFLSGTEDFSDSEEIAELSKFHQPENKKALKESNQPPSELEEAINELSREICQTVRHTLIQEAEAIDCQLEDLACTLLVFIATSDWAGAMQIGDGFIVVRSEEGEPELVFTPDKGEYVNETTFITSDDFQNQLQVKTFPAPKFICAASDGLEKVAIRFSNWEAYPGFFDPLEQCLQEKTSLEEKQDYLETFLNSDRINQRISDDKTLLIGLNCSQG